jgi:hypothetical protein
MLLNFKMKNTVLIICLHSIPARSRKTELLQRQYLLLVADARAAGMVDGRCNFNRCFSQQWNPAKYAFSNDQQDFQ